MKNIPSSPANRESIMPAAILSTVNAMERLFSGEHVGINDLPGIKADFVEDIENGTANCWTVGQKLTPWTPQARKRLKKAVARFVDEKYAEELKETWEYLTNLYEFLVWGLDPRSPHHDAILDIINTPMIPKSLNTSQQIAWKIAQVVEAKKHIQ